jgi:hypothetical protein
VSDKLYQVTLGRENLDALMQYLSSAGQVEISIDEDNCISFNIPRNSKIDVKAFDVVGEIHREIDKLTKRKDKLKTNGKRKEELENAISGLQMSLGIVSKIISKG